MKKNRPKKWSNFLNKNAKFIDEANIEGELYKITYYPGLIKGFGIVYGELYEILDHSIFKELDEYEDFRENDIENSLYLREKAKVQLNSEESVEAWVYFYNREVKPSNRIVSGKFADFLEK